MNIIDIYENLKKNIHESNIYMNEEMKKHTSFKIGGPADIYIKGKDVNEIKYIINFSNKNKIPITIIGNGSNVLVKDEGIRGITLQIDLQDYKIEQNDDDNVIITVGSGVKLGMLSNILQKKGISGLEFASGIPGTIGGAIRMNAGAYGKEIKEIVKSVTYINENEEIEHIESKELDFSYRHSRFINTNEIVLEAQLILQRKDCNLIKEKMEEYKNRRIEKQPIDMPSAGSTFKRGNDFISAQLIDQAGLKGYSIGGAQVSTKHAGFIVNTGNATAKDVLELVDYVIKTVYEKFGKVLQLEIEILG